MSVEKFSVTTATAQFSSLSPHHAGILIVLTVLLTYWYVCDLCWEFVWTV